VGVGDEPLAFELTEAEGFAEPDVRFITISLGAGEMVEAMAVARPSRVRHCSIVRRFAEAWVESNGWEFRAAVSM